MANLYADDCLVYCTGNSIKEVNENLQNSINAISIWYNGNKLLLNVEKCNTMLVASRYK